MTGGRGTDGQTNQDGETQKLHVHVSMNSSASKKMARASPHVILGFSMRQLPNVINVNIIRPSLTSRKVCCMLQPIKGIQESTSRTCDRHLGDQLANACSCRHIP